MNKVIDLMQNTKIIGLYKINGKILLINIFTVSRFFKKSVIMRRDIILNITNLKDISETTIQFVCLWFRRTVFVLFRQKFY